MAHSPASRPPVNLRVAVIEDDQTTRRLLEKLITRAEGLEMCGSWSCGENALAGISPKRPDVVVVDLELPGISGEDCIRALSGLLPGAVFLVLTVHEEAARVYEALRAGANGYLLKGSTPVEIISGIKVAHSGGAPLSPEIAHLVIKAFQDIPPKQGDLPLPGLSRREHQILEQLSTGLVPKEAAIELGISYETVRSYLKTIYKKLHVRSQTEAVIKFINADSS